jgi:hypothetical protein
MFAVSLDAREHFAHPLRRIAKIIDDCLRGAAASIDD